MELVKMTYEIALKLVSTLFLSRNGKSAIDVINAVFDVEKITEKFTKETSSDVIAEMFRRHNLVTAI